ncbi:hypothetical protein F4604DRAFT_1724970, partial [Suillus subluteus]
YLIFQLLVVVGMNRSVSAKNAVEGYVRTVGVWRGTKDTQIEPDFLYLFGGFSSCSESVRRLDIEWFSTLTHVSAALCLLKPAVCSFMHDVHMDFHLPRMLASTKSNDGHMGTRPTSILTPPDGCALYDMSFSLLFT